ncbi:MAG: hypothetical protein LKI80_16675 [Sporolactobacillus sp.]|jgi:hypothetical protein|nr:hypothetical protein [Sporolactobacillus sp.]
MSKEYEQIHANIEKLRSLRKEASKIALEHVRTFRELSKDIDPEGVLNGAGRVKKRYELRDSTGKVFLAAAHKIVKQHHDLARKTKSVADAIMDSRPEKPDDVSVMRFNRKLAALKTDLMLSTNAQAATQKLREFTQSAGHPYFAAHVADHFAELAGPIISTASDKDAAKKALTDEQKDVAHIYDELANEPRRALFNEANGITQIRDEIGKDIAASANKEEEGEG